jgi:hypothetical protein
MRLRRIGSVSTTAAQGRMRSTSPWRCADSVNELRTRSSTSDTWKDERCGFTVPCVELRDVEDLVQQRRHAHHRRADVVHDACGDGLVHPLLQALHQQHHGLHGLAQVVGGRGEEARLGGVGAREFLLLFRELLQQLDVLEAHRDRRGRVGVAGTSGEEANGDDANLGGEAQPIVGTALDQGHYEQGDGGAQQVGAEHDRQRTRRLRLEHAEERDQEPDP